MAIKHDVTEKGLGKTKTGTAIYVKGNLRYLTTKPKLKYASEERVLSASRVHSRRFRVHSGLRVIERDLG